VRGMEEDEAEGDSREEEGSDDNNSWSPHGCLKGPERSGDVLQPSKLRDVRIMVHAI
jgi:hypothetical protein